MIFFCSDQHLCHKNIIKYCSRPFTTVDEMNNTIISNHNALVAPSDTVYFLGDIILGQRHEVDAILPQLNGHKHLIIGNHDKRNKRILSEHFQTMATQAFFEEIGGLKNVFLCHNHRSSVAPDDTEVVLHGHIHGHRLFEYRDGILFINLSMEVWDYHPVSTEQIAEFISVHKRTARYLTTAFWCGTNKAGTTNNTEKEQK